MSATIDAGLESISHHEIQVGQTIKVFVKAEVFDEKGFPKWIELEITILRIRYWRGKTYILFTYPGCCKRNGRVREGFCRKVRPRTEDAPQASLLGRFIAIFLRSPLPREQIAYH